MQNTGSGPFVCVLIHVESRFVFSGRKVAGL